MKILVEKNGAKRKIYFIGPDLKSDENFDLYEGNYDLEGKTKKDYWYVKATNSLQGKTTAEKNADIAKKDKELKKSKIDLIELILSSADFATLKTEIGKLL